MPNFGVDDVQVKLLSFTRKAYFMLEERLSPDVKPQIP